MDFPPIFPPLPRNVRQGVPEGPSRPERVILRPAVRQRYRSHAGFDTR